MALSFAQAWGESEPPAPTPAPQPALAPAAPAATPASIGQDEVLVDPRSGEVVDLGAAPSDQLIDVVLECRRQEAMLSKWRKASEDELRRRLEREGRRVAVVGDYELKVDTGFRREWNADDLRYALDELVRRGVLAAGEIPDGLIKRTVNGTLALQVLNRLSGEPRELVEDCYRTKSTAPRLTVSPVPNLADALSEGD